MQDAGISRSYPTKMQVFSSGYANTLMWVWRTWPLTGLPNRMLLHDRLAQAMYHAKETGRGNFQFYVREMNARTLDRLKIEVGLRHALHRGEFALHYQPQIDVASGRVVGVEALLRWT